VSTFPEILRENPGRPMPDSPAPRAPDSNSRNTVRRVSIAVPVGPVPVVA
jgi:hypothetical protein